ncbi:PREDICTED: late embryogenesis abundant protein 31 [Tarenaya hassleriana]|uniref:late embryogenesis abundant protein 31 n=1 Tax=Tarenaya hassleriana TaxID=28532 RepID=UPI00053C3929|nr:PREDICTED: late embryogenesis abundant protein 31 [Tarenaya hassleriana]
MSQAQPERQEPIKYGDVFNVSGELADKPVAPGDANMMQAAETRVFGHTQKGGTAAVMQYAAAINERSGFVHHGDTTDVAADRGITVAQTDVPGARVTTEFVGGQVVGQYVEAKPGVTAPEAVEAGLQSAITIGEALEAAVHRERERDDQIRATGSNTIVHGGLAATAQSAATHNLTVARDEDKIKLGEVLTGATWKLPVDKEATREDAEGVVSAELRNSPNLSTHPGGVAASITAAARLNERDEHT